MSKVSVTCDFCGKIFLRYPSQWNKFFGCGLEVMLK